MLPVDDVLDALFLGAFLFGLLFTALSLILGAAHIGVEHDGHGVHLDHGNHGADHGNTPAINISAVLAFVAWFGGVGYLAHNGAGWQAAASIIVAILGGLAGGFLIFQFFRRVVQPGQQAPLDARDFQLEGTLARVSSSIREGGVGEIIFVQNGVRQVRAAKAADGTAIPRGTEVVVMRAERGVGLVMPWDQLVESGGYAELEQRLEQAQPDRLQ